MNEIAQENLRNRIVAFSNAQETEIKCLLREVKSRDLIACVWWIQDRNFNLAITRFMRSHAATMFNEDLGERYGDIAPALASKVEIDEAIVSTVKVLSAILRSGR